MSRGELRRGDSRVPPPAREGHRGLYLRLLSVARTALLLTAALSGGCIGLVGNTPPADLELLFNDGAAATIAPEGTPLFQTEPVFDSIAGKIGSHAPTLTAFPNGELLAAWYSYDGPGELDGAAIYASRRAAEATDWGTPELIADGPAGDGNPVLHSEADAVWLFYAVATGGWSTAHIEVRRSNDCGHTWTAPGRIDGPLGANVRFPPVRLADDTLLLPAYDDLLQRSLFFASTDGDTWAIRSAVSTTTAHPNLQPSIALLANQRLLAVMRNVGRGWLWAMASDDGGRTWSSPQDSGFPNPASPAALQRLTSGNLVLVFNDDNDARSPLSITLSADDGRTWTPPRILVAGDGDYAYPAIAQTPDGLIHITYSHDRQRIEHITLNEAWITAE